ncbi:hypothetical protein ACHWQZ_G014358 [Mnemiopsis leidyi]
MLRIEIPHLMKNILKEINKAVLKQQSSIVEPDKVMSHEEIVEFLAVYLNTMARLRDSTGENPLEIEVDIEQFEDEGHVDLHITESDFTDETKPITVSSLVSVSKSPKTGSLVSLQSHKSAEKAEDVKEVQELRQTEKNEDEIQGEESKQPEKNEEELQEQKEEQPEQTVPVDQETDVESKEEEVGQPEENEEDLQEQEKEEPEQTVPVDQEGDVESKEKDATEDVPAN